MTDGKQNLLGCGGVAAVLVLAVMFFARDMIREHWLSRAFPEAKLRELATLAGAPRSDASVPEGEMPYRKGKVLVMVPALTKADLGNVMYGSEEAEPPRIHRAHFDLPSSIRADSPAEVKTLITARTLWVAVGVYVSTTTGALAGSMADAKAKKQAVELSVYDVPSRTLIGRQWLDGYDPKALIRSGESHMGQPVDVADYVGKMPPR